MKFFRYALASLEEMKEHLEECRTRGVLAPPDYERICGLAQHTKATALSFKKGHETRCQDQSASRGKRGANTPR